LHEYKIKTNDLSCLIDGLNNAIIAYIKVIRAIDLECQVPTELEVLKKVPFKKLKDRFNCLKNIYNQLLNYEKMEV
jgi:hypothetical protein